jgi:hypothetical protein
VDDAKSQLTLVAVKWELRLMSSGGFGISGVEPSGSATRVS